MYYLNVISEKGKYNQTPASRKLVGFVHERKSKKNAVFINQNYHLVGTTYIICNSVTNTPHVNNSHNFFFFLFFFFQKHTHKTRLFTVLFTIFIQGTQKNVTHKFCTTIIMSKGRKIWIWIYTWNIKIFHDKISYFANLFKLYLFKLNLDRTT